MAEPQQAPQFPRVDAFRGLNNRIDPTRLGLEWQLQADNVLCDDANYLIRRPGNKAITTGYLDAYGTRNGRLLLITTGNDLIERFDDGTTSTLATGVTGAPFVWCELGYALFVMSPTAQWAIYPDQVMIWGSLCPAVTATTYPIADPLVYPPPKGNVLCARRSQIVIGVWEPEQDRSVIYFSRPDFPHEFRLEKDWLTVPGRITLLASTAQGLILGTDRAVFIDPVDSPMQRVADYGAPLNAVVHDDRDFVAFWTQRGLCKAFPFQNLTDERLVVSLRERVTTGLLPYQGSTYCVVSQTGALIQKQMTRAYTSLTITTTNAQGVTL
jgi:hypothetical protein